MNRKITLQQLSMMLSSKERRPHDECEKVLRELFRIVGESLADGENVKVKGFGTFKVSRVEARKSVDVSSGKENEIPAHDRIVFIPAKEMAVKVNAPFEMFETVVLDENLLEEELMQAEASGNDIQAMNVREQMILEEKREDEIRSEYPAEFESSSGNAPEGKASAAGNVPDVEASAAGVVKPSDSAESPIVDETSGVAESAEGKVATVIPETASSEYEIEDEGVAEETPAERKGRTVWGWYVAVGILALFIGVAMLWWLNADFAEWGRNRLGIEAPGQSAVSIANAGEAGVVGFSGVMTPEESGVNGVIEDVPETDTGGEVVPTAPSDDVVCDTVSNTRYLSTIAKEHYGNFNLWPYIYKENEKILGHPNRIRPGTRVVVPDLSKYGVDPKNKSDIEKAKRLGLEIYRRFDKSSSDN